MDEPVLAKLTATPSGRKLEDAEGEASVSILKLTSARGLDYLVFRVRSDQARRDEGEAGARRHLDLVLDLAGLDVVALAGGATADDADDLLEQVLASKGIEFPKKGRSLRGRVHATA